MLAMITSLRLFRTTAGVLPLLAIAQVTLAQEPMGLEPIVEFRPHCEALFAQSSGTGAALDPQAATTPCTTFEIRDPESLQTSRLASGDLLDLDIVLRNPASLPIHRFRIWISYDPTAFTGGILQLSEAFSIPTPGEVGFFPNEGYVKISAEAAAPLNATEIVLAHVQLRVTAPSTNGTPIVFFDATGTLDSRTAVFVEEGVAERNILSRTLGYLFARFTELAGGASSSRASTTNTASHSSVSYASSTAPSGSVNFSMLQVQGVRITTEGSTAFVAWDTLPSSEVIGYNIYYGTTSGRYIHKHSIDKSAHSLSIRTLPVGTTYYVAVRAVNASAQESEFSQEVAVTIGDPATSTSPLSASERPSKTPTTNGNISGETGASSTFILFLIASAMIGTLLAFRRQLIAKA